MRKSSASMRHSARRKISYAMPWRVKPELYRLGCQTQAQRQLVVCLMADMAGTTTASHSSYHTMQSLLRHLSGLAVLIIRGQH